MSTIPGTIWLKSIGDGTIALCDGRDSLAACVAIAVDHPLDLDRTIVYMPDFSEIIADIRGSWDDVVSFVRSRLTPTVCERIVA